MAKRVVLLLLLIVQTSFLFAQRSSVSASSTRDGQSTNPNDTAKFSDLYTTVAPVFKPSRDFIMIQFNYNNWIKKPDSIKTKPFAYSFNSYVCYDFPIKKTNLSFATGIGVNVSVMYLDLQKIAVDTGNTGARFVTDSINAKRDKFVTTYISAPFELRYYSNLNNRNKGFKAAIGLQVGTLLGSDMKQLTSISGTTLKFKTDTKRDVTPWNFAATGRVGFGNFSLFLSYNLTNVFKENAGPPITPAAVGICLTGL